MRRIRNIVVCIGFTPRFAMICFREYEGWWAWFRAFRAVLRWAFLQRLPKTDTVIGMTIGVRVIESRLKKARAEL